MDCRPSSGRCAAAPRALVVDDDAALRSLLKAVLDDYGFCTETASDGLAALALLAGQRFDVLILDLDLPRLDGPSLYGELAARGIVIPTIVVSAGWDARSTARDLGVEAMLAKPFDTEELCRTAMALARRAREPREGEPGAPGSKP